MSLIISLLLETRSQVCLSSFSVGVEHIFFLKKNIFNIEFYAVSVIQAMIKCLGSEHRVLKKVCDVILA